MYKEEIIIELIANSGEAKSNVIKALMDAKNREYEKAYDKMRRADKVLLKAHNIQTDLIQKEINKENIEINLLMVHAQCHLMNAITVLDLAKEMIDILYERDEQIK